MGILAKDFSLKLPVTPYRYFPASDVQPDQARHVHGVDAVVRVRGGVGYAAWLSVPSHA